MANLTALKVKALAMPGTYGDGGGLYLQVRSPKNRSWLFRFKLHRKAHLMGLGTLADVTLVVRSQRLSPKRWVNRPTK